MCEPATITAVVAVASTAYQVNRQEQQRKFDKGTAKYNARVAENEAQAVLSAGVEEENIQRQKTAQLLSKQRAQIGASGVDIASGSPLQLQEDTVSLGEADALRIRSNFEARADALDTSARLTRRRGQPSQVTGTILSGTSDFLNTGVADKWFTPDSAANQPVTLEA